MGQQPNIVLIMTDPQRADLLAAIARWTICLTDVLPAPSGMDDTNSSSTRTTTRKRKGTKNG